MAVGGTVERGDLIAGRYRLEAEIGTGGTGGGWRATEQGSNVTVELRRAHLPQAASAERDRARERLHAEAGLASLLDHPNIAAVHGLVEHDGEPWLVTRYVAAPNLTELTAGPLPPHRAAGIGAQAAGALAFAHSPALRIVHRAVAPRTILVGGGDRVTLTGFGSGERAPADLQAYAAPEVANGLEPGPQADVFSLGAALYEAVEGRPPWGDGDPDQVRTAAKRGIVEPPRRAGALGPVLARMLESRPRERPTAAEAAQLLAEVARTSPADARGGGAGGRRWLWVAVAAVVVVVAAGLVVWPRLGPATVGASGPPPTLGDPATAEPCALLNPEPLERFGKTILETDGGGFERCDVYLESGPDRAVARLQLAPASEVPPEGVPEERDGLVIVRGAPVNGQCVRTLRLSDGNDVRITGQLLVGAAPDPCAVADVATDTALAVLVRGPVPRRSAPFDARSLAVVDACALLDPAAVAKVPGLETVSPDPGFAGWDCDWENVATGASIVIDYDRDEGLSPDAGNRMELAGRDAATRPDEDRAGCDVTILHRPYTEPGGKPRVELLLVKVDHPAPIPDPCAQAVAVAEVAVNRLPAAP
ncbi:protein kinase domain-containing protein [Pseudonocardia kunmingensis]|uniref:protein kinase domain-containing protein n=1 Tax=Pseudonocardia kunmingensis TaxID=630975 RepID=UPI0011546602|nr:protein kinase [Pseudonocardia kunmingensis]